MCYSSRKDFGWSIEKESARTAEPAREPKPQQHPRARTPDADPAPRDLARRHPAPRAPKPSDRIPETV
jgi:hypothetical protein